MGLLDDLFKKMDGRDDPRIKKYYEAWNEYAPSLGMVPWRELPLKIARVIEKSEFFRCDSYEAHFVCETYFEGFDLFTFYLMRTHNLTSAEEEAANCFVGVVRYPFKGGEVILRDQRNRRFKDRGPGLNFEDWGFSEDTWVMAEPEVLAYQFFHPRMIEHFKVFWGYQFHAIPGALMFFEYRLFEDIARDMLKEPDYEFQRIKGFNNVARKFFTTTVELIPGMLLEQTARVSETNK